MISINNLTLRKKKIYSETLTLIDAIKQNVMDGKVVTRHAISMFDVTPCY